MERLLPYAEKAGALLKARGETIAVAESSAGGLIAAALLAVPGASAYFAGGHACVALAGPVERARTLKTGSSDRVGNMYAFASAALELLTQALQEG